MDKIEKADKSLEEAAEEYTEDYDTFAEWTEHYGAFETVNDIPLIKKAFIAGAEWQKKRFEAEYELDWLTDLKKDLYELGRKDEREQMMKEAVKGTVMDFSSNQPRPQVDVFLDPHKYCTGDKVRIIIVKEE